jgi:hypothetical protein
MHVTDDKAYATLTDVKNKTGDVFALADEYSEVTITSYNKSKYLIKRISQKPVPGAATTTSSEEIPSELEPAETEISSEVANPEILEAVTIETLEMIPAAEVIAEIAPEPELQVTTNEAPTVEVTPLSNEPTGNIFNANQIIGMFAGLGNESLWDRSSKAEQNWTRHAHVLL